MVKAEITIPWLIQSSETYHTDKDVDFYQYEEAKLYADKHHLQIAKVKASTGEDVPTIIKVTGGISGINAFTIAAFNGHQTAAADYFEDNVKVLSNEPEEKDPKFKFMPQRFAHTDDAAVVETDAKEKTFIVKASTADEAIAKAKAEIESADQKTNDSSAMTADDALKLFCDSVEAKCKPEKYEEAKHVLEEAIKHK